MTPDITLACIRLQAVKEEFTILGVPISRTDDPSSQQAQQAQKLKREGHVQGKIVLTVADR